jgi:hypothetical protein
LNQMHEELQQKKHCIKALERQACIQALWQKMANVREQLIQVVYHNELFCQTFY